MTPFIYYLAKLLLGNVLKEGTVISINPLVIWAWAGLLINAITVNDVYFSLAITVYLLWWVRLCVRVPPCLCLFLSVPNLLLIGFGSL